jgi:hypothetical protein
MIAKFDSGYDEAMSIQLQAPSKPTSVRRRSNHHEDVFRFISASGLRSPFYESDFLNPVPTGNRIDLCARMQGDSR